MSLTRAYKKSGFYVTFYHNKMVTTELLNQVNLFLGLLCHHFPMRCNPDRGAKVSKLNVIFMILLGIWVIFTLNKLISYYS